MQNNSRALLGAYTMYAVVALEKALKTCAMALKTQRAGGGVEDAREGFEDALDANEGGREIPDAKQPKNRRHTPQNPGRDFRPRLRPQPPLTPSAPRCLPTHARARASSGLEHPCLTVLGKRKLRRARLSLCGWPPTPRTWLNGESRQSLPSSTRCCRTQSVQIQCARPQRKYKPPAQTTTSISANPPATHSVPLNARGLASRPRARGTAASSAVPPSPRPTCALPRTGSKPHDDGNANIRVGKLPQEQDLHAVWLSGEEQGVKDSPTLPAVNAARGIMEISCANGMLHPSQ